MSKMSEIWTGVGSTLASIMFVHAMIQQYLPYRFRDYMEKYMHRILGFTNPYIHIRFHEFSGERLKRSEAYTAIEAYLSAKSSKLAKRLKAQIGKDSKNLVLSMDDHEEITDEFQQAKLWWSLSKTTPKTQSFSFYPTSEEKRYLTLKFHRRYREIITEVYLNQVIEKGKAIVVENRQRKLYTNNPSHGYYGYKKTLWSHVVFDHPATFDNIAMDPTKKKEIIDDLITFSKGKEYYAKVGKAWKRGYLLYGPPGTGKSTMIAAMANFLNYDVYDLELTAVKENSDLRKLLIETSNKSIIVIEDIDCSLDLTGQRKKNKEDKEETDPIKEKSKEDRDHKDSKVTLSGLLNFIDGLWSACGGERLIVFTTNYVEKLDPALIRRGRMDKHIELSYCGFEGFKILARNYLDLDSHHLFEPIRCLIGETQMTPADVAENLMPKTINGDPEICLKNLIEALEKAKEDARLKAEEEAKEKELSTKSGEAKKDAEEKELLTKSGEAKEEEKEKELSATSGEAKEGDSSTKEETEEDGSTRLKDKECNGV
ncbi:AAA+ ATPase domain [Macleaya cordata]|uniref:AAA+ ATPase domain n=1 Tax=Macleaya cordata TaxID=56857 RepID=A0A200QC11_MACCD|nr:AAA+ ATPase domain [Macleaya cordata]